ncbi:MAG: hypothetical protein RIT45_2209 [Pseudomonadota bacterium]
MARKRRNKPAVAERHGATPAQRGSIQRRQRVLAVVRSDATFQRAVWRGQELWLGRCLMCGKGVMVDDAGRLLEQATLEHIVPRTHGGDDSIENLAIACARCNHQKGARVDSLTQNDPRRREIVLALLQRRRERWRDAEETR